MRLLDAQEIDEFEYFDNLILGSDGSNEKTKRDNDFTKDENWESGNGEWNDESEEDDEDEFYEDEDLDEEDDADEFYEDEDLDEEDEEEIA